MALAQLLNNAGVPFSPFPPLPPTWASGAFTWPAPDAAAAAAATAQVEHRLHSLPALEGTVAAARQFAAAAAAAAPHLLAAPRGARADNNDDVGACFSARRNLARACVARANLLCSLKSSQARARRRLTSRRR